MHSTVVFALVVGQPTPSFYGPATTRLICSYRIYCLVRYIHSYYQFSYVEVIGLEVERIIRQTRH